MIYTKTGCFPHESLPFGILNICLKLLLEHSILLQEKMLGEIHVQICDISFMTARMKPQIFQPWTMWYYTNLKHLLLTHHAALYMDL